MSEENVNMEASKNIDLLLAELIDRHDKGADDAEKNSSDQSYHLGQVSKCQRARRLMRDVIHAESVRADMLEDAENAPHAKEGFVLTMNDLVEAIGPDSKTFFENRALVGADFPEKGPDGWEIAEVQKLMDEAVARKQAEEEEAAEQEPANEE